MRNSLARRVPDDAEASSSSSSSPSATAAAPPLLITAMTDAPPYLLKAALDHVGACRRLSALGVDWDSQSTSRASPVRSKHRTGAGASTSRTETDREATAAEVAAYGDLEMDLGVALALAVTRFPSAATERSLQPAAPSSSRGRPAPEPAGAPPGTVASSSTEGGEDVEDEPYSPHFLAAFADFELPGSASAAPPPPDPALIAGKNPFSDTDPSPAPGDLAAGPEALRPTQRERALAARLRALLSEAGAAPARGGAQRLSARSGAGEAGAEEAAEQQGQGSSFRCQVCLERLPKEAALFRGFGDECAGAHPTCRDCAAAYATHKLHENLIFFKCPSPGCSRRAEEAAVIELLEGAPAELNRFLNLRVLHADKQSRECPHCGVVSSFPKASARRRPAVACPACRQPFCFVHAGAHIGTDCKTYEKRERPNEAGVAVWQREHATRCRKCRSFVEKNGGCNHVTCRCGHSFCYLCGGDYSSRHFSKLNPFGCPGSQHGAHSKAGLWARRVGLTAAWGIGAPVAGALGIALGVPTLLAVGPVLAARKAYKAGKRIFR
eukprot:tig00021035_g17254.t1